MKTLQRSGFPVEIYDESRFADYDVLVIAKRYDAKALDLAKRFRSQNKAVILDLSDNHLYNPKKMPAYMKVAADLEALLKHVDLVTVCSAYLGNIVREHVGGSVPVLLVEDAVEDLDVVRLSSRKRADDPLKLLWFGSHGSPNADAGIKDITRLESYFSGIELPHGSYLTVLSNNKSTFEKYSGQFGIPARYAEWDEDKFCDLLSSADAVVIPIGKTPFSKSKSNNRLATALWYKIPVLADMIPAYKPFAEYAFLDNWAQGIGEVIASTSQLRARIEAGAEFARKKCTNEAVADQWKRAFHAAFNHIGKKPNQVLRGADFVPKKSNQKSHLAERRKEGDSSDYPSAVTSILRTLPLRSRLIGQPFDRLLARLKIERGQFDSSKLPDRFKLGVVINFDSNSKVELLQLLDSVKVQSVPNTKVIVCVADASLALNAKKWTQNYKGCDVVIAESEAQMRESIALTEFCVFAELGDTLDPSACAMISLYSEASDFVGFGYVHHNAKRCEQNIVPNAVNGPSLDHVPLLGNGFAVRSSFVAEYSGDVLRELIANRLHMFQSWLRHTRRCRTANHPELLLFKHSELEIPKNWFRDYESAYEALFEMKSDHRLNAHPNGADVPYSIRPVRRAFGISILIAYRDKPDMTMDAIRSIITSRNDVAVQIILIDNQSSKASAAKLEAEVSKIDQLDVTWVSYPYPFNHSAQMNVGVSHAKHPVLLFMNNDCLITSDSILDELATWAMHPGIGTVGVKIGNPDSGAVAAGIAVRDILKNRYDSPVEDHTLELTYSYTRRVFGNSFAFCAIEKQRYTDIGGLDEARFPVGYNDVDFAARLCKSGLMSISLGHHVVQHPPGQSRSKTDETGQKIMLRALYGDLFATYRDDFYSDTGLQGRPIKEN